RLLHRASKRERDRGPRRRVGPLNVVDGNENRLISRQALESGEHADRDRPRIDRHPTRLLSKQCAPEWPPLRSRKATDVLVDVSQEVAKRRERHLPLDLRRTRNENAESAVASELDGRKPQRRLADAGLSLEHECRDPGPVAS